MRTVVKFNSVLTCSAPACGRSPWVSKLRQILLLGLLVLIYPVWAQGSERRVILDTIRPFAEKILKQEVRFRVDRLNVDSNWALLVGELVPKEGAKLDWSQAKHQCDPNLDKMLFAVLAKTDGRWRIAQLNVCASEPPYWYFEEMGGFAWPCGVYAGLSDGRKDLESECRRLK